MIHRDDIPFDMIESVENDLGKKITFPGDLDDEALNKRIKKHHARSQKIFEQGRCFSCYKKIPSFEMNQTKGVTLENSSETWKNSDCVPSFSMMQEFMNPDTEVTGIMCMKCMDLPTGVLREKSWPEEIE